MAESRKKQSLLEQIFELIDLTSTYFRQQLRKALEEGLLGPVTTARRKITSGILAGFLFSIAAIFLAVSLFELLLVFVPVWAGYGLVALIFAVLGILVLRGGGRSGEGRGARRKRRGASGEDSTAG